VVDKIPVKWVASSTAGIEAKREWCYYTGWWCDKPAEAKGH
jgi:hypothetical protein